MNKFINVNNSIGSQTEIIIETLSVLPITLKKLNV